MLSKIDLVDGFGVAITSDSPTGTGIFSSAVLLRSASFSWDLRHDVAKDADGLARIGRDVIYQWLLAWIASAKLYSYSP